MMRYRPLGSSPNDSRLGRYIADDLNYISNWPLSAVQDGTIETIEKTLRLPYWHKKHDQGREGSCVGHAVAMERAIANTSQNYILNIIGIKSRWYDPLDIWNLAKEFYDEWEETKSGDDNGTSVNAGYDVARLQGLIRVKKMIIGSDGRPQAIKSKLSFRDLNEGIEAVRWATNVDEMRTAISEGKAIAIGVNWYKEASEPQKFNNEWWIGREGFTRIEGGHALTVYGASDRRQAFKVKNNWDDYPLVWLPYIRMGQLLDEYGESAIVTDR